MKDEKINRTKWLHVRLTEKEYQQILLGFTKTTTRKLSDYIRKVILGKPIIGSYRNQSMDDFVAGMIKLKTELNSIGNNLNQVVKKLNTFQYSDTITELLKAYEGDRNCLVEHLEKIELFIEKNAATW